MKANALFVAAVVFVAACQPSTQTTNDLDTFSVMLDFATETTGDAAVPVDGGITTRDFAGSGPTDLAGLVAARPYTLKIPSGYDAKIATPLIINLHGLTGSGSQQEMFFKMAPLADAKTFLYVSPDGLRNALGQQFWNATDGCCTVLPFPPPPDDVSYIAAIIDDVRSKYTVDDKRIFIMGHSNGGFLTHRLACELAPRVAAVVSLAGAQWKDPMKCPALDRVSVVQVHGDVDERINYNGGTFGMPGSPGYPSAKDTVATWAQKNGCTGTLSKTGTLDVDSGLAGMETDVEKFSGCPANGAVELWTIRGGKHVPNLASNWAQLLYDFLMAHPKP